MTGREDDELAVLLRAAIGGDEKAYAAFLGRVALSIRVYARTRIVKGGVDPEDIVQETLLAIHLKRHTWMTDAPVMPWVYAIARFKLVDAFRRRGSRMEVDLDGVPDLAVEPDPDAVSPQEMGRILDTLSPGQRSVVASISLDGRSISETAERMGMTETAVRVALHRGLAAIARRFGRQ